jgi:aspartate/methionine/tyrosine aminotransferase
VQRAAVVAWGDEDHVVETRARYAAKREVLLPALHATGLEPAGGDATFFLWLRVPGDGDAEAFALRLLDDLGIVVAPGPFFGPGGEGHVRAALVPTLDACRRAAELLASWAA